MAPALTQVTESTDLSDATKHSLPPKASTNIGSPNDHIKIIKESQKNSLETIFPNSPVLISHSDCLFSGLAPPACGRAEGRPEPTSSPNQFNMDDVSLHPIYERNINTEESLSGSSCSSPSNMGLQSCITNVEIASDPIPAKGSEVETMMHNPNDLFAMMGHNVEDIIVTLQNIAKNPELLDAAAIDLQSVSSSAPSPTSEHLASVALNHLLEKQNQLERRKSFLIRRLNRITARGLGITVSNQLSYLLRQARSGSSEHSMRLKRSARLKSAKQDNGESSKPPQVLCETLPLNEIPSIKPEPLFVSEVSPIVTEWKAATLSHNNHDSDATESSSGGESCDENDQYSKINTEYKPINQRAFYRFCKNRGLIASKWMWIQSRITELDEKISSQEKLYSKLRFEKQKVKLIETHESRNENGLRRNPAEFNAQDPALTCLTLPMPLRTTINGYHPSCGRVDSAALSYAKSTDNACARTMGVHKFKRRKLVNLRKQKLEMKQCSELINNTLCNCPASLSCILCVNSRSAADKSRVISDKFYSSSIKNKLAAVDSSLHPVLSTQSGILQSETYSNLLCSPEWHKKAFKVSVLAPLSKDCKENTDDEEHYGIPSKRRRKDLRRSSIRRPEFKGGRGSRRHVGLSADEDEDELIEQGWHLGSSNSSPCPSPGISGRNNNRKHSVGTATPSLLNSSLKSLRQNSHSYDINNIVIPTMSSNSRVETIKYKEIPTPKWRIRPITDNIDEDAWEDVGDEAVRGRHARSEAHERKRFLEYSKTNEKNKVNSSRSSRSRRTDSSGTNTPDHPLSPRALDPPENSPMASPPGTPQMAPSEDSNHGPPLTSETINNILSSNNHKSNEQITKHLINQSSYSDAFECPPSTSHHDGGPEPQSRTRRVPSCGTDRTLRSMSIGSIVDEENDRRSPFPYRDFPLTESDYQVLVNEDYASRNVSKAPKDENSVETVTSTNQLETGPRDSPLSELTDSALEEDVGWEDESTPDWTISAVHDHSGGFVLQVQKN